jgi:serpin B
MAAARLAGFSANGNLIFSPLAVYSALSLVAAGARGTTLDELLAVLGASSSGELAENVLFVAEHALADRSTSGGPLVAFASGVWHDAGRPLEPAYKEAVVTSYKAEIRAVDFRNKVSVHIRRSSHVSFMPIHRSILSRKLSVYTVDP